MAVTVTMLQTRRGEDGSLWNAGSSYSATDAFAAFLITSNLATGALPQVPTTGLSPAQQTAVAALVSGDWNSNQQAVIDAGGGLVVADDSGNLTGPGGAIAGGGGGGSSTFAGLSDKTTADIPATNTPTATALALKAPLANPTFTGTVAGITKTMVGLGNVDNTADTAKPVSTAQQTALNLKANLAGPTFTGTVAAPTVGTASDSSTTVATTTFVQAAITLAAASVWIDVRKTYGTNHAAIVAAVAALNASTYGGVLYFSAGSPFSTTGGHVISKMCWLLGDGQGDFIDLNGAIDGLSLINCTTTNVNCFEFTVDGCKAAKIGIKMTAGGTPTSGAGLLFTKGFSIHIENVWLHNFYTPLRVENGANYVVASSVFSGGVINVWLADTLLPDGGDVSFYGNQVIATRAGGSVGLYLRSGGGVKLSCNKFNNYQVGTVTYQVFLEVVTATPLVSTIGFWCCNNSFENSTDEAIMISCAASNTGTWNQIIINGNQIGRYISGNSSSGITIQTWTPGTFDTINIAGNIIASTSVLASAITLKNVSNVDIDQNTLVGHPRLLTLVGTIGSLRNGMAQYSNTVLTDGATITPDVTNSNNNSVQLGGNRTLALPNYNWYIGQRIYLAVLQDATGNRTLNTSAYKWASGTPPTLSTAPNALDLLTLTRTNVGWVAEIQKGLA